MRTSEKKWNDPIHPGELLADELEYIGMTAAEFAERIGMPQAHLDQILKEERPLTAEAALRIGTFFGTGPGLWLNLQRSYEEDVASRIGDDIGDIVPYQPQPQVPPQTSFDL